MDGEEQLVPTTATLAGNKDDCESEPGGASATVEALTACAIQATLAMAGKEEVAGFEDWTETSSKTAEVTPGKRPASRLLHVERLIARIRNDSH